MKINFNSHDSLPLNKMLKLCNMVIVVRSVFMRVTNTIHSQKIMTIFSDSIISLKSREKCFMLKKTIKIWDVDVDNIVISKLIETKTNSKYLIGYLDKVLRPSALILPNVSRHIKAFKVQLRQR